MKNSLKNTLFIICLFFLSFFYAQSSSKYIELEYINGSENAKEIMKSPFYYDALDNWSPFGSDIGIDTYYLYVDWRSRRRDETVRSFVEQQLRDFGYPQFNILVDGTDVKKLNGIVDQMRDNYVDLNMIDITIISLAFSQLFLEGYIQPEVKIWAEAAFSREQAYLDFWDGEKGEREERKKRMDQMLSDLRKAKVK